MKHFSFLLRISCILWTITTCAGQSTVLKEDFSKHGVLLILPDDSSYESELQRLGFSSNAGEDKLPPFSVLVKNKSQRGIAAFGLRFTRRSTQGDIATSDVVESQPSAFLDSGHFGRYDKPPEGLVMAGATRLVSPDGIVDPTRKVGTSFKTDTPWTIIKVQLDSVVFDDGEAVGPNKLGAIEGLKARIDAQQDLMEEISARFSQGEQLHVVLEELSSAAPSKSELAALSPFDPSNVPTLVRQQYLDELATTAKNFGDEVARGRLHQLMYTTRPTIRWTEKGGK